MTGEPIELPIACTLDAGELRAQERRWAQLIRTAGIGRAATPDGVELRFRVDEGVEDELEALVATERECCAWARWEVGHLAGAAVVMPARAAGDALVMRARAAGVDVLAMRAGAAGDGAAVLQSMFLRDA